MDPLVYARLEELIRTLKQPRDWVTEVNALTELIDKLGKTNRSVTVRAMAKIINKSKSWIGVSVQLARGFKTYPEIKTCSNRNEAYLFLKKKNKMRRFLES